MGRSAGPGDDHPDAPARRLLGIAEQVVGRPMRGYDPQLRRYLKLRADSDGVLEEREVRPAAADDPDEWRPGDGCHDRPPPWGTAPSSTHVRRSTAARARASASSVDAPIAVTCPILRRSKTWRLS